MAISNMTPEERFELFKFERMVKDNRVRKLTPHLVWADGSKESIFLNDQDWFQAGLYEAESLDIFYLEDLWDGLLDGVKVALRRNENYQEEALMGWAHATR